MPLWLAKTNGTVQDRLWCGGVPTASNGAAILNDNQLNVSMSMIAERGAAAPSASSEDLIDLREILGRLNARKLLIAATATIGLIIASINLHLATPTYTTYVKVTPTASNVNASGGSRLGGISSLAALAGVSVGGAAGTATPFELFLDRMKSREAAEHLARDQRIMKTVFSADWDETSSQWRPAPSAFRAVRNSIKTLLGIPSVPWQPPGAAELQEYLDSRINISKPGAKDPPITTVSIQHKDRAFSAYLLNELSQVAERRVRGEALERARRYSDYLSARLKTTYLADHRVALTQALQQQEESIMMAGSGVPYAALIVERPTSSPRPTEPRGWFIIFMGLLGGTIVGTGIAIFGSRPAPYASADAKDTR